MTKSQKYYFLLKYGEDISRWELVLDDAAIGWIRVSEKLVFAVFDATVHEYHLIDLTQDDDPIYLNDVLFNHIHLTTVDKLYPTLTNR